MSSLLLDERGVMTKNYIESHSFNSLHLWPSQVVIVVKNLPTNTGDLRDAVSIPGSGRSIGEGHGNPPQYSCLENPMDTGAWWATVCGVTKSRKTKAI